MSKTETAKPGQSVVTSSVKTVEDTKSSAPPPQRKTGENYTVQVAAAPTLAEAEKETARLRAPRL